MSEKVKIKVMSSGPSDAALRAQLNVATREAERLLGVRADAEAATRAAARKREAAADKSVLIGSPAWQAKVNRRGGNR